MLGAVLGPFSAGVINVSQWGDPSGNTGDIAYVGFRWNRHQHLWMFLETDSNRR